MTRIFPHRLIPLLALAFLLTASICQAAGSGAVIAVYNSGRALVKETRVVTFPEGAASVVFSDVPDTLDPTSIRAIADGMKVHDIEYRFNPISRRNLLDAYVGKELTVILPDPSDVNGRILKQAKLLSTNDGPVFMVGNEVYVGEVEAMLLPKLPKELDGEPILTLTAESEKQGKKNVALSYLMGGLNWRADYTLTLDKTGKQASIEAWATINNTSGQPFQSADIRLIAGDVQRAYAGRTMDRNAPAMLMESAMKDEAPMAAPTRESFSQYHVYDLNRYISLPAQGAKQVSLFSADQFGVTQELTSRFNAGPGQRNGKIEQNVELSLTFLNNEANKLGSPMPGGLVRVFMPDSDGNHLLAGEAGLSHTAKGEEVRLVLGRAFDVNVDRVQTSFERKGKNVFEIGWRITVRNGKDTPQTLKLLDSFPGQWEVISADAKYTREDSSTIAFDLTPLAPTKDGKGKVINYTVRINY